MFRLFCFLFGWRPAHVFRGAGHPCGLWRHETAPLASLCRCGADIAFGLAANGNRLFLLILLGKNSPVGRFFNEIGFPFIFSLRGAVAAAFVVSFPLMYRAVRGAMESMDKQAALCGTDIGRK